MALLAFCASGLGVGVSGSTVILAIESGGLPDVWALSDFSADVGFTDFWTSKPSSIADHNALRSLESVYIEFELVGAAQLLSGRQRASLKIKGSSGTSYIYEDEATVEGTGPVIGDLTLKGYPKSVRSGAGRKIPFSREFYIQRLFGYPNGRKPHGVYARAVLQGLKMSK